MAEAEQPVRSEVATQRGGGTYLGTWSGTWSGTWRGMCLGVPRASAALGAGVVSAAEVGQELVTLVRPLGVLGHDPLEDLGDVTLARVAGVPHVLAIVVTGLQGVVLHRDQVEGDVVETGLTGSHGDLPSRKLLALVVYRDSGSVKPGTSPVSASA